MNIEKHNCRIDPSIEVVVLRGRLGIETTTELTAALLQALKESARGLVLDMSAVDFLSSSGLRMLFMIYTQAEKEGKHLAMFRVQPSVYKILKIAASDTQFRVRDSEEEAVKG
jgi:anti-anti-sigma factor